MFGMKALLVVQGLVGSEGKGVWNEGSVGGPGLGGE